MTSFLLGMIAKSNDKIDLIRRMLPQQLPNNQHIYCDLGCFQGHVLDGVLNDEPTWSGFGIDQNFQFLQDGKVLFPNRYFVNASLTKDWLMRPKSLGAISMISVLHEVYSQLDFEIDAVVRLLANLRESLVIGGRIIVREPALPSNADEQLIISLSKLNGANPSDDQLNYVHPDKLSSHAIMRRFLSEYILLLRSQDLTSSVVIQDEMSYRMPAKLISSFIRKRTFVDTPKHWETEMLEVNEIFSIENFKPLMFKAGFSAASIHIATVYEDNFYGGISDTDGIAIKKLDGRQIQQSERFPSHIYAMLENREPN